METKKFYRSRFFVGKPCHVYGKSETVQGDNITMRDIIRDFTLQVQRDEFENKDFFYDFDVRSFADDSGNINVDALINSLDRYVPLPELDIQVANHEQLLKYYTDYVADAKAYFAEKEKQAKLAEQAQLDKNTPATSAESSSVEEKLRKMVE